jgi:hypothetical protein
MTAASDRSAGCRVVDEAKLPAAVGGSVALCRAVEKAVAARSPGLQYSAEVKVLSPSRLSARLMVGGRALPDQNFAVSDRDLNAVMIDRFAQSIAEALASSSGR